MIQMIIKKAQAPWHERQALEGRPESRSPHLASSDGPSDLERVGAAPAVTRRKTSQ